MFYDYLSCYQDYDFELPIISEKGYAHVDFYKDEDGEVSQVIGSSRQNKLVHKGSFTTRITVHVRGTRLLVDGNPSRFNRIDNLFGLTTIDQCIDVYNVVLHSLGLPALTKCTKLDYVHVGKREGKILEYEAIVPDGCVLTRLDLTTNMSVGAGCVDSYLKALSMMPYRRSRGNLHANGKTVDWLSLLGNARAIYPCVYDKANELTLHSLPKVKRTFGEDSEQYEYLTALIDFCKQNGVTRHEQKIHSCYLNDKNLQFYGLSKTHEHLTQLHEDFLNIDQKLKVSHMDLRTITQTLISERICTNTKAANSTALYAINWMHGDTFDPGKSQVKLHRARLRKIGIDIMKPCNLLIFSPVIIKEVKEITRTELQPPPFYRHASLTPHLRLVA